MYKDQSRSKEELEDVYRVEDARLQSFNDWPKWAKTAPVDLARAGFYYFGKSDTVKCFVCNAEIGNWEQNDEPLVEHVRYSSNCPFVTGSYQNNIQREQHTGGGQVPTTGRTSNPVATSERSASTSSPKVKRSSETNQPTQQKPSSSGHMYPNVQHGLIEGTEPHFRNPIAVYPSEAHRGLSTQQVVVPPRNEIGTTFSVEEQRGQDEHYSYMGGSTLLPNIENPMFGHSGGPVDELKRESQQASRSRSQSPVKASSPARHNLHVNVTQPSGAAHHGQEGRQVTTQRQSSRDQFERTQSIEDARYNILTDPPHEELHEYCPQEDLLDLLASAHSPFYSHINNRIATFLSWKRQGTVQAKTLAEAGLYFIGEEDRVRCFMCNGSICNWQRGDIPWYEHSRWFGNCAYLKRCMKNPVIKAIVETAQRISEGSGGSGFHPHHHGHGQTQCDDGVVTEEDMASDVVKNLLNMGFPEERIHSVVATHGKSVLSHEKHFINTSHKDYQSGTTSP